MKTMKFHSSLFLAFIFLLTACQVEISGPTPIAAFSPSPLPPTPISPPPSPTATFAPSARYFLENFNAEVKGWSTIITSGEPGLLDLSAKDGNWVFDLGGKNLHVLALYDLEAYKNVRIDFSVKSLGEDAYSLNILCRYTKNNGWYQYEIFNTGLYNLYYVTWDQNAQPNPVLLAEGGTDAIHAGPASNQFTVICKDRALDLYINDQLVRSYTDNQYVLLQGQIGIGVFSFERAPVRLAFDWLKVSLP